MLLFIVIAISILAIRKEMHFLALNIREHIVFIPQLLKLWKSNEKGIANGHRQFGTAHETRVILEVLGNEHNSGKRVY